MRYAARKVLACFGVAVAVALPAESVGQTGDIGRVHDPVIMKQGDTYYLFSTGPGIPIRRSGDLVHWKTAGRVLTDSVPPWARQEVPGVEFPWAPDISFFNGKYHLYYSLSTGGRQRSVIALATNKTLDPSSPEYRWEDQGKVVESFPGRSSFNAIDPNVAFDKEGQPWLSWGSWWGGIKMRRLDSATGMLSGEDTTLYSLAARAGVGVTEGPKDPQALEAPFIVHHGDHYYLFVSFDFCCRGVKSTYNIRVGRAERITGPYIDREGVPLTEGGGTPVLSGSGRIIGPGHNAVLTDGGKHYLVHHFYDAEDRGRSKLQIRPLEWGADGWPRAKQPLAGR